MKKTYFLLLIVLSFAFGCAHSQDCVDGINKLPLYGHVKKCKQQLDDDAQFLADCDKLGSRKDLSAHMIMRGWEYFDRNVLDTAMMRFNQAWLLDSLNADIYWGIANILGKQQKFKESLPYFKRSLALNPNNAKCWRDESVSEGNMFVATKDINYLNAAITSLKTAAKINPNDPQLYGALTSAYSYFMQKDSARKYLKLTDKLDPNAVNPEVRKMLGGN